MKRALLLLMPAVLLLAIVAGCDEDDASHPSFTRLRVTPACGVAPLEVEGYAILSGGNESGDPMGANNNLDIKWSFGDGGTGSTTLAYHNYAQPGDYTVTVTGTDPDGNTTTASYPVVVSPDSLVINVGSDFPDGNVTCVDTVRFNMAAESCDIDFPAVLGDSVKMQFTWDMGDMGGVDNSTYNVVAPEFRFFDAGVYDVEVAVFYPAWAVERRQTLTFTVASAPPVFWASPETFDFGDNLVGTPTQETLLISNLSCGDLIFSAVSIDNPDFNTDLVPMTLEGNEEASFVVGFNASSEGVQTGVLSIQTNDPLRPVIDIPLTGVGVALP